MTTKTNEHPKKNTIEIRPYNIKELAAIYEVDRRTMTAWLNAHEEAIGVKVGRYFFSPSGKNYF
jgi:hypothetical protein